MRISKWVGGEKKMHNAASREGIERIRPTGCVNAQNAFLHQHILQEEVTGVSAVDYCDLQLQDILSQSLRVTLKQQTPQIFQAQWIIKYMDINRKLSKKQKDFLITSR